MSTFRFGAIDIGSNALRLLITDIIESELGVKYKRRLFIRVPLRLGEDAFLANSITAEKSERLMKAISSFKSLLELFDVMDYRACGTAALREAKNGKDVIERIVADTGVNIEIIDGKKEAQIICSNHVAEYLNQNKSYLYIDVGGGSTQLTLFSKNRIMASSSFPVGTIRLFHEKVKEETWENLKVWLKTEKKDVSDLVGIGSGGNINRLFKMANKKEGKMISDKELKDLFNVMSSLSIEERIHKFALNTDRADVIVPAAKIFLSILKWASIEEIYVPKIGLADGIVHLLYEKQKASAILK